jgi:hypothetical protein
MFGDMGEVSTTRRIFDAESKGKIMHKDKKIVFK